MAAGGPRPSAFYVERQALTRSPATPILTGNTSNVSNGQVDPGQGTTRAGDGLILANLMAITVSIYPWVGTTLAGAGSLLCWVYNPYQVAWTRCIELDFSLVGSAGFPARTFLPVQNVSRLGTLINWLTSGVTVSGANNDVLVRIDGFTSVGSQAI